MMRRIAVFVLLFGVSFGLTVAASASEYSILRPTGAPDDLDVKVVKSIERKMSRPSKHGPDGLWGSSGIIDTVTWRSLDDPTVNFGFLNPGDSLLVWLVPEAACSLVAIRYYVLNWEGSMLVDVWNAKNYDPKISSLDSADGNGWWGTYVPIDDPSGWVPGDIVGHTPLGGSALDPAHHYWGPFPFSVTEAHAQSWVEIPAIYGLQGEVDLGRDPFYISAVFWRVAGWGFGSEYPWTTPYHFFKFYSVCCGPDGAHDGWFIRQYFMWYEAIVKYYENTPPSFKSLKVQNYTYAPGPFPITVTIEDQDAEDATRAGVASAELVYDINGVVDRTTMQGPSEGGLFTAEIPELAVGDVVTYHVEATDFADASSQTKALTFARLQPDHPGADILVVWDWSGNPDLDTFFVDLFDVVESPEGEKYEFELWNISERNGIDASVIDYGWSTIYISGWGCVNTLPGSDPTGNLFVEWLDAGTTQDQHRLLYIDQDYFCVHPEYACDWDQELAAGEFMYDYFGVAFPISDNHGAGEGGYDSVAIGVGDFDGIRVNYMPDAWDPTDPQNNLWTDWLVELTDDAEQIFVSMDYPDFGVGVRLDRGNFRTAFIAWADFFAVDSLQNGDLVPRPALTATVEKILEWFKTGTGVSPTEGVASAPQSHRLAQNYPNPFNPETRIDYQLAEGGWVELAVYNVLGQKVRTLVAGEQAAGAHTVTWDGRDDSGLDVASGVYFYRMKAGDFSSAERMVLMR